MKQVLVVDDLERSHPQGCQAYSWKACGLQTAEAEDGQKALAACSFLMPDAILLDWNMPVMDGFEFLRELRKMPGGNKPKVVFCTTENDVAHIARAMHAGADDYIMKPFDKQIVQSKLEEFGLV